MVHCYSSCRELIHRGRLRVCICPGHARLSQPQPRNGQPTGPSASSLGLIPGPFVLSQAVLPGEKAPCSWAERAEWPTRGPGQGCTGWLGPERPEPATAADFSGPTDQKKEPEETWREREHSTVSETVLDLSQKPQSLVLLGFAL